MKTETNGPKFPTQTLNELIAAAFSPDRIIDHEQHPVLRLVADAPPKKEGERP